MAVHFSSASPEWYTPQHILEASKAVLYEIDCDPCSNSKKSPNVPARVHYTKEDDGLSKVWYGSVFLNPPYGNEISDWVERLVCLYEQGDVTDAIALLPARTDTQWFHLLCSQRPVLCFVKGRLKFSAHENSAPFPSVVAYFGDNSARFHQFFAPIGLVFSAVEV